MAEFKRIARAKYLSAVPPQPTANTEQREKLSAYPLILVDKTDTTLEPSGSVSFVKSLPGENAAEKSGLAEVLPTTLPQLPWQLERLLSAASSNVLTVDLPGVPDAGRYTLAWGCSYLTGDRDESLSRLWAVYRAWQGVN